MTASDNKIACNQRHLCPWCMDSVYNHELIEKHLIIPKSKGCSEKYSNLVWFDKTCHQAFTRKDNEVFEKIKMILVLIKKIKKICNKSLIVEENKNE